MRQQQQISHSAFVSRWSLGLGFALFMICAASAVLLAAQTRAAFGSVQHTFEVTVTLDEVQIHAMRAEINRRGFVLTGDLKQLAPYQKSKATAWARMKQLRRMSSDNPAQKVNLGKLTEALSERFVSMEHAIRLRKTGHSAAAVLLTSSKAGQQGTAAVVQAIEIVRAEEKRLLAARTAYLSTLAFWSTAAGLSSAALLIALGVLVLRERKRQNDNLAQANTQLASDMQLRERAEAELELLANNATDAVLRFGGDGTCLYASPSAQETFGIAPEALVGKPLHAFVDSEDQDDIRKSLDRLMSGEARRETVTCRQARRDRSDPVRWLEASTRAILRGRDAAPRGIIAAVRDVTERKQLELALAAAKDRAEIAASAKASFLANMSHEIRTPMNGVLGFTDLLLAASPTPEQRRYLELMADSGRAMMRLLNDILDLAKIDAGQMRVTDEPIDLRHKLRRCVGLMASVADQKGLRLHVSVTPAVPARILGDPLRFRQILLNLLGNAIKFTPDGSVSIVADVSNDSLVIDVTDTGIGIPADKLGAIFEEFAQADMTTAGQFGGTGLGLSVSSKLARLMGGRLSVKSKEGQGTTFSLTVPVRSAPMCEEELVKDAPRDAELLAGRSRVLIAEDHDINQILIMEVARQIGLDATLVPDGAEAVAAVKEAAASGQPYALVLMDMQMPILDGLKATRQLRAEGFSPEALPIVALTANAFADDVSACFEAGMNAHLSKPLRARDLTEVAQRFLSPSKAAHARSTSANPKLLARFEARTAGTLSALEKLAATDVLDAEEARAIADGLHKMAGTAALFGREELGKLAANLERDVVDWAMASRRDLITQAARDLRKVA